MEKPDVRAPIDWLLEGETWVVYHTRLDLLNQSEDDPQVRQAREAIVSHPQVRILLNELSGWPWTVISSHKSAGQPFHKLTFVADLGLTANNPALQPVIDHILDQQAEEGPIQLPINVPVHFGGNGQDTWAWALCDTPLLAYALAKFGLGED